MKLKRIGLKKEKMIFSKLQYIGLQLQNTILHLTDEIFLYRDFIKRRPAMRNSSRMIDSLNADELSFFSLIALFNNYFSIDWLVPILGGKVSEILLLLEDGVKKGWLAKKESGTFYFKDINVREELENRVPPSEKESIHRRIVKYLMTEPRDNNEKLLLLSHHLQHIKCSGALCQLLMQAGDLYLKSFKQENALGCYAKILNDLSDNEDTDNDKLFIESAIKYSKNTTAPMHGDQAILKVLKAALKRAIKQRIKSYQAHIYMHLAKNEWLCSQNNRAILHFNKGWALALKLGQKDILRSAHTFAMYFSFWKGCYSEGINNYEKFVPDIQIYHEGQFPLLAALLAGHCYAQIGHISQGIGMLEALYNRCQKKNDLFMASYAKLSISVILLDMGKTSDALDILEPWVKKAHDEHNDWAWIWGELASATAYYRTGNNKLAINHLEKFLEARKQAQMNLRFYSYALELCFAIKNGKLPPVNGLSFEKEIEECIAGKNVFLKGVAYRYKALQQQQEGASTEQIIQSLNTSITFLTESGQKLELAMSQFELARQFAHSGNKEEAKINALIGAENLSLINKELIPDDLKETLSEVNYRRDRFGEILRISQEFMAIRDNKELVQNILSRVNQITGAERGAIFLLEHDTTPQVFNLRASKNLTAEDVSSPTFNNSLAIMRTTVEKRQGIIQVTDKYNNTGSMDNTIRSRICVPMIIKDKVIGVLYNDNSLLNSAFKDEDLDILSYFASLAASALENAIYFEEIQHLNEKLKEENLYYEEQQTQSFNFDDIIGESEALNNVFKKIEKVAGTDSTVVICGETGVGKEMVARAIHRYSNRRANAFIRVFCNALPETLIPSELFGHEKGAFTGANNRRMGRFELADGGTLFLDEIGDLPLDIQTKLLIVLQSKEFERVGGSESISSDFRLIVATNRNLEEEVQKKNFRSDLYYRINVFPIYVPPLRERKEDIPLLVKHFLKSYTSKIGKKFSKIPSEEMNKLIEYEWPGNIRELDHVIERGVILSNGPNFKVPELGIPKSSLKNETGRLKTLRENEHEHILSVLQKTGWKIRGMGGAAGLLDVNPTTLEFRMKKLGIQRQKNRIKLP
jgi:formate hydrogenlyase transcriptional activator